MAGRRNWFQASLALGLVLAVVQTGRAQSDLPPVLFTGPISKIEAISAVVGAACNLAQERAAGCASVCKVYSLADMGSDANLCKWIADTIPQMIQPASWTCAEGKAKLSYYAPGKVLVINQSPAVHAQIEDFLRTLKSSLPQAAAMKRDPQVMRAQFNAPDVPRPVVAPPPMPYQAGYPIPYPPTAPKHLFHFIIRYEGAGIIDENVAKFAKAMSGANASNNGTTATMQNVPPQIPWAVPVTAMADPLVGRVVNGTTTPQPGAPVPTRSPVPPMPLADAPPPSVPPMPPASNPGGY